MLLGYQNFYFGPKTAEFFIFGQILAYLAKYWQFWPKWFHARPKYNANKVRRWFFPRWFSPLTYSKKIRILARNSQIWPKICICGHFLPNIGLYDPFGAMPDQKNNATRCLGGLPLFGYQNYASSNKN